MCDLHNNEESKSNKQRPLEILVLGRIPSMRIRDQTVTKVLSQLTQLEWESV